MGKESLRQWNCNNQPKMGCIRLCVKYWCGAVIIIICNADMKCLGWIKCIMSVLCVCHLLLLSLYCCNIYSVRVIRGLLHYVINVQPSSSHQKVVRVQKTWHCVVFMRLYVKGRLQDMKGTFVADDSLFMIN